jgi:hypothetical protein
MVRGVAAPRRACYREVDGTTGVGGVTGDYVAVSGRPAP